MTKRRKQFINNAVILPLAAAILVSAAMVPVLSAVRISPFADKGVSFSDYEMGEIKEAPEYNGSYGDVLAYSELPVLESNTLVGNASFLDITCPVIYDATDVNATGKLNIKNDRLIGEIGCSYMELFKKDAGKLHLISKGEIITIETFYSSYELEVVKAEVVKGEKGLKNLSEGIDRGVVLYTDNSVFAGNSDERFACAARIISGGRIDK